MEFKGKMRRSQPAFPRLLSHGLTSALLRQEDLWVARFYLFSGDFVFVGV